MNGKANFTRCRSLAEGYVYNGEVYKSLSPIAFRITGTKWSGPAFFGTKPQESNR